MVKRMIEVLVEYLNQTEIKNNTVRVNEILSLFICYIINSEMKVNYDQKLIKENKFIEMMNSLGFVCSKFKRQNYITNFQMRSKLLDDYYIEEAEWSIE